jgi:hypothetical protein
MIKTLLVLGTAAGLLLAVNAASAGTCTTEIEALQKQLARSDAGMGPTNKIVETGRLHPPTSTMNQATKGTATSSEDVLNQNQGEPTVSQGAAADESGTATTEAHKALERARQLDQAGNEAACMTELTDIKTQLGVH